MKAQLLATLENSKNYTLSVATAMPEQGYAFRPADEVWDFRELLHHIAYGIQWWGENYILANKTDWAPAAVKGSKREIIAALEQAYAALKNTVDQGELGQDAVSGFYATIDHITHHRGQAVLYLRCKGLTPPEYMY